jgi:hypothetical protein
MVLLSEETLYYFSKEKTTKRMLYLLSEEKSILGHRKVNFFVRKVVAFPQKTVQ